MAFVEEITKLDTYHKYLERAGVKPSKKLDRIFACGLPMVWLYLKAIGLEELYFQLMERAKSRISLFREIFYLLILSNGTNKFFPCVPKEFLHMQIPSKVEAALVQVDKPAFEMAYGFTREQLTEVLEAITKPGYMIRLGDQRKTIGIMYSDNAYHVYHAANPHALQFNSIEGCVDLIMRVMNDAK